MFDEKNAYIYEIKKNPFYLKTTWAQHKTYALNYIVTFKKTLSMSLPLQEMTTTQLQMESLAITAKMWEKNTYKLYM